MLLSRLHPTAITFQAIGSDHIHRSSSSGRLVELGFGFFAPLFEICHSFFLSRLEVRDRAFHGGFVLIPHRNVVRVHALNLVLDLCHLLAQRFEFGA